ncbi:MAG TPA: hypothetical protein VEK57_17920 [Thermoanaerobaculia bacterium]|nr:hypothetical protein [Thermoanaerobaculia bacterium]
MAPARDLLAIPMHTRGETVFAEYLAASGIPFDFERAQTGRSKRPDFAINWNGVDCFFDVKDREKSDLVEDDPLAPPGDDEMLFGGAIDPPYRWIREQIEQGRRKFREFKGSPCAIVMFPADGWDHDLREPDFALGAMYGDYGIVIRRDPTTGRFDGDDAESHFLDKGKMIRPRWRTPQNTTVSALLTLRSVNIGQARLRRYIDQHYPDLDFWWDPTIQSKVDFNISERHTGVIVWENAFAATPLPADIFRGPYDERWGREGNRIRRVHLGAGVAECLQGDE